MENEKQNLNNAVSENEIAKNNLVTEFPLTWVQTLLAGQ